MVGTKINTLMARGYYSSVQPAGVFVPAEENKISKTIL
jgi:hypothetical protein